MRKFLHSIHSLPEEARKLLAGICIVVVALAFFSVWGSFMSSRLVALGPSPGSLPEEKSSRPSATARLKPGRGPPSLAQGLVQTFSGLDKLIPREQPAQTEERGSRLQAFFAAIGDTVSGGIEFLYLKLSRYVPPNL